MNGEEGVRQAESEVQKAGRGKEAVEDGGRKRVEKDKQLEEGGHEKTQTE